MPRECPYQLELSEDERQALEAMARRYTSPYRDVLRAKSVLYAAEGLRNDRIADRHPRARLSASGASASSSPACFAAT